jgi:hypothetical protein
MQSKITRSEDRMELFYTKLDNIEDLLVYSNLIISHDTQYEIIHTLSDIIKTNYEDQHAFNIIIEHNLVKIFSLFRNTFNILTKINFIKIIEYDRIDMLRYYSVHLKRYYSKIINDKVLLHCIYCMSYNCLEYLITIVKYVSNNVMKEVFVMLDSTAILHCLKKTIMNKKLILIFIESNITFDDVFEYFMETCLILESREFCDLLHSHNQNKFNEYLSYDTSDYSDEFKKYLEDKLFMDDLSDDNDFMMYF